MAPFRLLIARLRVDQLPALLIIGLVFATALAAAATPRLFNRVADDGLRYEVREATVVERNLQLGRITRIEAAPGQAMASVDAAESGVEADLPDTVRSVISGDSTAAKSIVYSILHRPTNLPGFLTVQFQDRLDEHVALVEGRMPSGEVGHVPAPDLPPASVPIPEDLQALTIEVAISTSTAEELDAAVGDTLEMVPDSNDALVGPFGFLEPVVATVVGIYEVGDPDADYWVGDRSLHQPQRVPVGINTVLIYATGLASPDAYPGFLQTTYPMRYAFRYYVDPERMDAGMLDDLVTDLQRMESSYASFASQPSDTVTTLQTGLLELTDRYQDERRATEAVLTTAAIGPAAVAVAAIAILAMLAVQRRRGALILLRGRGSSGAQLVGSHVIEGLLLAVAPAAAALLVATSLIDARAAPASSVAAGLVAAGAIVVLAAAVVPIAVAPMRRIGRDAPAAIGASPRRLAFEGLAVGLAIGGVVLLRQRGLAGGSAAGELAGVDPFLAAVPALVGLAVGIVTLRLYPYPVRVAGWAAASGRDLVPSLGLRRAERQTGTGQLPLVVLLLTVAIGTFSSTMLATVDTGQVTASWQEVGAAHRIDALANTLPAELDPSTIDGVRAVAAEHETDASIGLAGGGHVDLVAIDAPEYEDVTNGTPAEVSFPTEFVDPPPSEERPGSTENPVPAIVSRALARSSTTPLGVGDTFELTIAARFATFKVVRVVDSMPGQGSGTFMIVPRGLLDPALGDRPLEPTSIFVRAPASAHQALVDAAGTNTGTEVRSQATTLDELRERPLVDAVRSGFAGALVIALGYAALAVVIALLLSGSARAHETAHLRTLGIGRRQVTLLAIFEHAPLVLVAVVAGLVLGVAVAWVVLPGLGLSAFTGSTGDPALTVDAGRLAGLTLALLAIVAIGVGLAAWAQRRADPARAIRSGME
jgi:putative ABC transport system permease protein